MRLVTWLRGLTLLALVLGLAFGSQGLAGTPARAQAPCPLEEHGQTAGPQCPSSAANVGQPALTLPSSTFSTMGEVPVGRVPEGVAVNTVTNRIYVANSDDGTVSVVDGTSNTVIATITVGSSTFDNPGAIAVDPLTNRIYASNLADSTVAVIDGASNTVIATINGLNGADGIAVNPLTNKVYVANEPGGSVFVIDGASNVVVTTIPGLHHAENIAVNPLTNKIYVTSDTSPHVVFVIDGSTDTLKTTIPIANLTPDGVAVNPVTNLVYVSSDGKKTIDIIDGSNDTLTPANISVPDFSDSVDVNVITNQLGVGPDDTTVSLVDLTSNSVAATVTPPGSSELDAAAANPLTNTFYVADESNNFLAVISAGAAPTQAQVCALPAGLVQALGVTFCIAPAPQVPVTPPPVETAPTKTCTSSAPATGQSVRCTLTLTSQLGPTSFLTDTITSPSGATITACSATGGLSCQPVGSNATSVTVNCPGPSPCATGATVTLTLSSSTAGALRESVSISPAGFLAQTFTVTPNPAVSFTDPQQSAPTQSCNGQVIPLSALCPSPVTQPAGPQPLPVVIPFPPGLS